MNREEIEFWNGVVSYCFWLSLFGAVFGLIALRWTLQCIYYVIREKDGKEG